MIDRRIRERTVARWRGAVLALLIITASACSSIVDSSRRTAEAARVLVTGTSGSPLRLITSTNFIVAYSDAGDEHIQLLRADTVMLPLPIDRQVPFRSSDRVYVSLFNPSMTETANVEMRILVDGQEVYRQAAELLDASLGFSYFLF